jgi:hypothetical protein
MENSKIKNKNLSREEMRAVYEECKNFDIALASLNKIEKSHGVKVSSADYWADTTVESLSNHVGCFCPTPPKCILRS